MNDDCINDLQKILELRLKFTKILKSLPDIEKACEEYLAETQAIYDIFEEATTLDV